MLETPEQVNAPLVDINQSKLYIDDMNEIKSNLQRDKSSPYSVVYICDTTSVKFRILYYHKNIFKISYAKFLNAVGFIMRRAAIFPLLLPLNYSQNFMNLIYLSVTFSFSIKAKQNFEDSIKLHLPAFSFLMFLQLIADYLVKIYINIKSTNIDPKGGYTTNYTIELLKLIANDNNTDGGQGSIMRTSVLAVFALGFCFIVVCGKYVFSHLFVIK